MQRKNKLTEKYISSQWGDFLELALLQMDKSLQVYKVNSISSERNIFRERKVIAPAESAHSVFAIVSLTTAIESFVGNRAYHQKLNNFDTFEDLASKLEKLKINSLSMLTSVKELTVCRDSIIHGHLWLKHRTSDRDTFKINEIRSYLWSPFKGHLRKKYRENVNWTRRETKQFHFKIIPLDVSYLDCVKALKIMVSIMEHIFEDANITWRPPVFPYTQDGFSKETTEALRSKHYPVNWLEFYENNLAEKDKHKYVELFKQFRQLF